MQGVAESNRALTDFGGKSFDGPEIRFRANRDELDAAMRDQSKSGGSRSSGPSTKDPAKVAATTAAQVEQINRTSQARQTALVAEGEARRVALEQQGAQRRVNIDSQSAAREEAAQRAHLSRLIADKERAEAKMAMQPRGAAMQETGRRMMGAGLGMTAAMTAPAVAAGGLVLRNGIRWEDQFSGVRKTVDGSPTQMRGLEMGLRDMAAGKDAIPVKVGELAKIAENAGQLGVARENVLSFTKVMAQLGTTTNLSSEQAATGIAQIANVMGTPQSEFDKFGSTLVDLGNKGASTESEILAMATRIAGAGKQIGLSESQVLAYSSALASVGIDAEAGGSAISTAFINISSAVRAGGDDLDNVAKVAGMSGEAFRTAFQNDAAGAMNSFVQGLGKIDKAGGDTFGTLEKLGLTETRLRDALLRLSGAGDLLSQNLQTGDAAWKQNSALAEEAGKKYETTASQIEILQNRFSEAGLQLTDKILKDANALLGEISEKVPFVADKIGAAWDALGPAGKKAALGMLALVALSGPLTTIAGTVTTIVGGMAKLGAMAGALRVTATVATAASAAGATGAAATGAVAATGAAGATGAAAAGAGATAGTAAAATAGTAALGPFAIALAALVPIYEVVMIGVYNFQTALAESELEAHNTAMSLKAVEKNLSNIGIVAGDAGKETRAGLKKLADDATGAGEDTGKLLATLKEATEMKIAVGKDMHLDAAGKAVVTAEIDRLIASLSSRTINLKVNLDKDGNTKPEVATQVGLATGAPLTPDQTNVARELDWQARAARVGKTLSPEPERIIKQPSWLFGTYDKENLDYDKQVKKRIAERKAIIDAEKASGIQSPQASSAQATQSQTRALTEQTKAVEELKDAELERERARLNKSVAKNGVGDGEDYTRYLKVAEESNKRKEQIQSNWAKSQAEQQRAQQQSANDAARAEEEAQAKRVAAAKEAADQLLAIEQKSLQERLALWNAFGNTVAAAAESFHLIGAEGGNTSRMAAEAQMARREFAEIPEPLKAIVVGLGAINDEMTALTRTRDEVRGMFSDLFKDALKSGVDLGPLRESAAFFEKSLDYERKMQRLHGRGARASEKVVGLADSARGGLSNQIENIGAQRVALRKSEGVEGVGGDNSGSGGITSQMVRDAALVAKVPGKISACANVAGQMLNSMGVAIESNNNVAVLEKNLQKAGARRISLAEAKAGDTLIWDTELSRKYGDKRNYGAVSGKHVEVYEGNGKSSGNKGGAGRGNPRSLGSNLYDKNAIIVYDTSRLSSRTAAPTASTAPVAGDAAVARAQKLIDAEQKLSAKKWQALVSKATGMTPGEEAMSRTQKSGGASNASSTTQATASSAGTAPSAARTSAPPTGTTEKEPEYKVGKTPKYDGSVLEKGLPKGWGKAVTDVGLRPNESRAWQTRFQEMLLDTDKATKDAARFGMSLDEYAASWRRIAERQDLADSGARAREALRGQLAGLEKSTDTQNRFSGRENAYSSTLYDMEKGGYDFLTGDERQNLLLKTRADLLAQSAAQSRDFRGTEADNQKVLAAGRPLLQGAATDLEKYNQEVEEAKIRVEAWARVQPLLDMASTERDPKKAQATRRRANEQFHAEVKSVTTTQSQSQSDAAQVDYARNIQARQESLNLLRYELSLLEQGAKSQEAITRQVEVERAQRETMRDLLKGTPNATNEQKTEFWKQAKEVGAQAGSEFDASADKDRVNGANSSARNTAREMARLKANSNLIGRYGSNSPVLREQMERGRAGDEIAQKYDSKRDDEGNFSNPKDEKDYQTDLARANERIRLQIALDLKGEQIKAEEEAATATVSAQRDVRNASAKSNAERLANEIDYQNKARALRGQGVLSAKEESELVKRFNLEMQRDRMAAVTEARVTTLDAERAVKEASAQTAAQRLEVEKWYQAEVRKLRGQEPMSEEESAEMDKQGVFKGQSEEMEQVKRHAEQTRDIFRDSIRDGFDNGIEAGLAGLGKKVLDAFVNAQIDKTVTGITKGMYGDKSVPGSEGSGGVDILGAIFGRKPKNLASVVPIAGVSGSPLLPGASTDNVGMPGYVQKYNALAATTPVGPSSILSQVPAFLSAVVGNSSIARVAEVAQGSSDSSSRLLSATFHIASATQTIGRANINARSSSGTGGGAGTTKSGNQVLGDVLGVASMFA